jgi:shikimate dehydrogenase
MGAGPVWVASRSRSRAAQVADRFGAQAILLAKTHEIAPCAEILINATSASTDEESPDLGRLAASLCLSGCELVVDLNYGRPKNLWDRLALANGARFMDGLSMLAHQAARSFALWWDIQASGEEFMRVLRGES